jgi:hypothetical protein
LTATANYSFQFKDGTLTITPRGTTATPVFTPAAGTYAAAQTVTIKDATAGTVLYFTTNGTAPTSSSTKYTVPLKVTATETIKVIGETPGYPHSAVVTATFTIE